MKKRLLIDMDGVLANVYSQFIRMEFEETGIILNPENLNGKKESEAFPHFEKHVRSKEFFRTVPRMEGAVDGLNYLNNKYNLYIVSSATQYPDSLLEKYQWLNEFFPYISWEQMIFCGRKDPITGDIMIDDHTNNLDHFDGQRIMFTQPHNYFIDSPKYIRVNTWAEMKEVL